MKSAISRLIIFAAAILIAAGAAARTPDTDIRPARTWSVAFYNLENLFDTINTNGRYDFEFSPAGPRQWDSAKYAVKINNLANAIANMVTPSTPAGPAIIGVAEVENSSVMRDLIAAEPLRGRHLQMVHHDSPDPRGIDVGLLYDPEQFTVLSVANHILTVPDNPDFRTRSQMCVTGLLGADSLSVIVCHWPSRLGGQRESEPLRLEAARLARHIADSLWADNPRQGIVIMGDLNDDPSDRSVTEVIGALRTQGEAGPHDFYNPWWRILDSGRGTLTYRGAWNLFDQILVSGTLLAHNGANPALRSADILDIPFLLQQSGRYAGTPWRTYAGGRFLGGYSDHLPTHILLHRR